LDAEKVEAEKKLRELFDKLPPRGPHHHCRGKGVFRGLRRVYFRLKNAARSLFGLPPLERPIPRRIPHTPSEALALASSADELRRWGQQNDQRPPFPIHKFIRAAKRVQRANKKLKSFEQGFISEEGIKEREWYRHLGVAPGKWLGYGATTFPALTEAITIEKNVTLAKDEAGRLIDLIDRLAVVLTP
jgi:N-acetylated-alpha-linked acidic dipeptidase